LPYSQGGNTLCVAPSALLNNAGNITIGGNIGNTLQYLDVENTNSGDNAGSNLRLITRNPAGTTNVAVDMVKYKTGGFTISNGETSAAGFISFNVGAPERMRINSSGVVTTPYQPYLQAIVNTLITDYNFTDWYAPVVKYDNIVKQIGSNYNTSTGLFTAPVAGVYAVHAGVYTITNARVAAGGICYELWGIINGNREMTITDGVAGPSISSIRHGSGFFYLNAGDTFGIKAYGPYSTGYGIEPSGVHSVLRIVLLG
jgi:hypothetical protein